MKVTFSARLKRHAQTAKVLVDNRSVCAEYILEQAQVLREQSVALYGEKVAVVHQDLLGFVIALVAFDGWCESLYLCSPSLVPELEPDVIQWRASEDLLQKAPQKNDMASQTSSDAQKTAIATKWHLASSGTTGKAKWFSHSFSSLANQVKHSTRMQSMCWANLYTPYRFAGLQVLLQSLLSGASLVQSAQTDFSAKLLTYVKFEVSAISATPSMWRKLLMTQQLKNLPVTHITLGGEIADQALLDNLHYLFPQANIRHIYASTEAGVGFVVADGLAGFPVKWLDEGINNTQLMIDDNHHLKVKPSSVLDSTLSNRVDEQGFLDTEDVVQIIEQRVHFLGRASGAINVGGNKVHPEKVEAIILGVKGVNQARVYGQSNSLMGALVVADVVLDESFEWSQVLKNIRATCKESLQRFEIPVKLSKLDSIAVSASGKLTRTQING